MIPRILIACGLMASLAPLHADEASFKISLGVRDTKLRVTNVVYPLAFRIENTGKAVIKGDQIPGLFFKGVVHALPKAGSEEKTGLQRFWRTVVYDLQPGAGFESPVVGNILTFFPSAKDGVYQAWWTLGGLKSNVLDFSVLGGKIQLVDKMPDKHRQPIPR